MAEAKKIKKNEGKQVEKKVVSKTNKKKEAEKSNNNIWDKFMVFCHGVKNEVKKIRWTTKQEMIKYSIATIIFILFCSIFFYGIDTIFALIQSLFN